MNLGKTLFAQLMEFVPWTSFDRIVARYSGDARVCALPSTEHFRVMAYAQLTWRESLRDIEATLGANPTELYAMGLRQAVRRSTLADANERASTHAPAKGPEDEKIIRILEEYIRPAVEGDGGHIAFKSFDEGLVTVSLRGSCSGCPSSMVTLKQGIENLLKHEVPGVREVVAEEL